MKRVAGLLVALGVWPLAAGGQVPVGPEFLVNTHTSQTQQYPAVAADAAGNFVVVWDSLDQDGNGSGVFARWHDSAGTALGASEVRVNEHTTGFQTRAHVASTADGQVVVVWESSDSITHDGSGSGIFARRYDATGEPLDVREFRVNSATTLLHQHHGAAVALDGGGNFVVVWQRPDGSSSGIFGRRYHASGVAAGDEFQVNAYTTSSQSGPSVAVEPAGGFVVVWVSGAPDGDVSEVFARRYNSAGASVGDEFRVNTYTTGSQASASVASDVQGNFVVAWSSGDYGYGPQDVWVQRFDATGAKVGQELQVNTYTTAAQRLPAVASTPSGSFVVAWQSYGQDGHFLGGFGQRYDALGTPDGTEFPLNSHTTGHQRTPAVAADARGHFVATWSSDGQDGDLGGVFGQRFAPEVIFRDGFEDIAPQP